MFNWRILVLLLPLLACGPALAQQEGTCVPDATTLCLLSDRFSVEVEWDDTVTSGQGQVMSLATDDTGFFSYQDSRYVELMIKTLDACSFNDRFWVFSAGLSDAIQTITVTDTVLGSVATYNNAFGDFPNLADIDALPCSAPFANPFSTPIAEPLAEASPSLSEREELRAPLSKGPVPTALSLVEGRFQVEVTWEDFDTNTGAGVPEQITDFSGVFWFFSPSNFELILKVVDGSSSNGFYQLFFSATTNVEYTIEIVDLCGGAFQTYTHPLGGAVETIVDLEAFSAEPGCGIFSDGFESGDILEWSSSIP